MSKENFRDDSFLLMKGLQNICVAKDYFENLKLTVGSNMKQALSYYISKCDWIVGDIKWRLPKEAIEPFTEDVVKADNLYFDGLRDMLLHFSEEDKAIIENLVIAMSKGEKIEVEQVNEPIKTL